MADLTDRSVLALLSLALLVSLSGCNALENPSSIRDPIDKVIEDPGNLRDMIFSEGASFKGTVSIPGEGVVGEPLTAVVTIENDGSSTGTYTTDFVVDGESVQSKSVGLAPGETESLSFTHTFDSPGTYHVEVAAFAANVTITESNTTDGNGTVGTEVPGTETSPNENDTTDQTKELQIHGKTGTVFRQDEIRRVNLTVSRASGSADVDFRNVTVEWVGPDATVTLEHANPGEAQHISYTTVALKDDDGSHPVLNDADDVFIVSIEFSPDVSGSAPADPLEAGESAQIWLKPDSGIQTGTTLTVPDSLQGKETVDL